MTSPPAINSQHRIYQALAFCKLVDRRDKYTMNIEDMLKKINVSVGG